MLHFQRTAGTVNGQSGLHAQLLVTEELEQEIEKSSLKQVKTEFSAWIVRRPKLALAELKFADFF